MTTTTSPSLNRLWQRRRKRKSLTQSLRKWNWFKFLKWCKKPVRLIWIKRRQREIQKPMILKWSLSSQRDHHQPTSFSTQNTVRSLEIRKTFQILMWWDRQELLGNWWQIKKRRNTINWLKKIKKGKSPDKFWVNLSRLSEPRSRLKKSKRKATSCLMTGRRALIPL